MKNHSVFEVFRRWSLFSHFLTCKNHGVFELFVIFVMLRVKNHMVFDVFTTYFLGGAQRAPKIDFGRVLGAFESPLGGHFEHVGGAVELLGHRLGPTWSQKRQDGGLLGSSTGGEGVSEAVRVRF